MSFLLTAHPCGRLPTYAARVLHFKDEYQKRCAGVVLTGNFIDIVATNSGHCPDITGISTG